MIWDPQFAKKSLNKAVWHVCVFIYTHIYNTHVYIYTHIYIFCRGLRGLIKVQRPLTEYDTSLFILLARDPLVAPDRPCLHSSDILGFRV